MYPVPATGIYVNIKISMESQKYFYRYSTHLLVLVRYFKFHLVEEEKGDMLKE